MMKCHTIRKDRPHGGWGPVFKIGGTRRYPAFCKGNGPEGPPCFLLCGELFALQPEGLGLFLPAGETGLLESVEHRGVPVPGGIGHRLVEGAAEFDDAVVTAYRYGDTIGIFIGNVTQEPLSLKFIVNALRDYGIESGKVFLADEKGESLLCEIKNGKASIDLTVPAYGVVLLEIR